VNYGKACPPNRRQRQGSMIAIVCMGMVVHTAVSEIYQVSHNNQYYGDRQYPKLVIVPALFGKQQEYANNEDHQGQKTMVVPSETMY
jgi:hypothetical protein